MEIKTIRCPSCGGNLNIENVNQSLFYCQYCGSAIQLETNRNKGYDMEHGRLDARAEMADTVLQEIEKIKPQLLKNAQAENDVKYYPSAIIDLKTERGFVISEGLMEGVFRGFLKGLGVLFIGAIIVIAVFSKVKGPLFTLIEAAVLLAPIYIPVIGIIKMVIKMKEINGQIADCEKKIKEGRKVYEETKAFLDKNAKVDIPPRFRQEAALDYIIKGLKAREFVSLEQALFRCEEVMDLGAIHDSSSDFEF